LPALISNLPSMSLESRRKLIAVDFENKRALRRSIRRFGFAFPGAINIGSNKSKTKQRD